MPQEQMQNLPLQRREAEIQPAAGEENIFEITWTTGATVRRWGWMYGEYDEELVVDKESIRLDRINSGNAPVLNSHGQYTLTDVIGVVIEGSVRIEDGTGTAKIKLSGTPGDAEIVSKVKDGIIRNVSVGYRVHEYLIEERDGQLPLRRAVDWEPFEVSLVPIPADAGAGVRSNDLLYPCAIRQTTINREVTMTTKQNANDPQNPTPAAAAPAANPPAVTQEQLTAARAEGAQAEARRQDGIRLAVRGAGLTEAYAEKLITKGYTVNRARKAVINQLAKRTAETGLIRSAQGIQITRDEMDTVRNLAESALLHRYDSGRYKLEEGARQFRGMSLLEIGRDLLEKRGVNTRGLSRAELAGEILGISTRGGAHTTSDFPYILANVANKTLRNAYEAAPQTFKAFSRKTTNPDFKEIARNQFGDAPSLEKVAENGEYKRGTISEGREKYSLATYGKIVAVTRQVLINDDLSAFTRLPEMYGRAAADLESDTVWAIITANAAMADGTALFHANHGNLAGSGAAITVATLGNARSAMRQQKGLNGRLINVLAKYLLVPSALETVAQQYVTSTNVIVTKASDVNPFANALQVIAEPRLDANSTTAWYTAADPSQIDTLEYAYLEGEEGVYLETRTGFDVDGVELKARLDFAAKAIDHRGLYKNAGA